MRVVKALFQKQNLKYHTFNEWKPAKKVTYTIYSGIDISL